MSAQSLRELQRAGDMTEKKQNPVVRFLHFLYVKLFAIDDTPQKVAAGVGIGVFFGVFPGLGPLAALFFAFILKVNRAGALLGSILTNTWISVPVFVLAAGMGSFVTGSSYADMQREWSALIADFSWGALVKLSAGGIFIPIITGYILVSICIGIAAYAIALAMMNIIARRKMLLKKGGHV